MGHESPKDQGNGIFKRDMLGHARRCPTSDILKVTHKGQHAAMRPARHHHCGHLLSFVNLILKWSVRPPEGLFSFLFREPFALDFRLSDIGGTNSIWRLCKDCIMSWPFCPPLFAPRGSSSGIILMLTTHAFTKRPRKLKLEMKAVMSHVTHRPVLR